MSDSLLNSLALNAEKDEWTNEIAVPELAGFDASAIESVVARFSSKMSVGTNESLEAKNKRGQACLLYTSPSPRDS